MKFGNEELFIEIKGIMKDCNIYDEADEIAIMGLSDLIYQLKMIQEELKVGHSYKTYNTGGDEVLKANPSSDSYSKMYSLFIKTLGELGLTSKSRKVDGNGASEAANKIKDFLNGDE